MALLPMSPNEALAVFSKWADEDAGVFCAGDFFGCTLRLLGAVSVVRGLVVQLESTQHNGIQVDLASEGLDLRYGEVKDFDVRDVPEYALTSGAIAVGLPTTSDAAFREKLIFVEVRNDETA